MAAKPPSAKMRTLLRKRIKKRIDDLYLNRADATGELGLTPSQLTRLHADEDIFSLDRLVDAATAIGLTVRMTATRPYG